MIFFYGGFFTDFLVSEKDFPHFMRGFLGAVHKLRSPFTYFKNRISQQPCGVRSPHCMFGIPFLVQHFDTV